MRYLQQKLCELQAEIFEKSAVAFPCGSATFIYRFLKSEMAAEFDKEDFDPLTLADGYLWSLASTFPCLGEEEGERYSLPELHWIGYIYRAWSILKGKSSKRLYRDMKPSKLRELYFVYHTFDVEYAIDRIEETLPKEGDYQTVRDFMQLLHK